LSRLSFSAFYDANPIFWEILDFFNKTGLRDISGIIFFIPIWLDNIKLQSITHKAIFNYLKHMVYKIKTFFNNIKITKNCLNFKKRGHKMHVCF
jgi:hypothetical protein